MIRNPGRDCTGAVSTRIGFCRSRECRPWPLRWHGSGAPARWPPGLFRRPAPSGARHSGGRCRLFHDAGFVRLFPHCGHAVQLPGPQRIADCASARCQTCGFGLHCGPFWGLDRPVSPRRSGQSAARLGFCQYLLPPCHACLPAAIIRKNG